MKVKDISGIKPRKPKQIAQAGITLATGMLFLPFIPFKKAKNYGTQQGPKLGK